MSVYYDLYASGNPQKKDEQQPLHARVIPSGTLNAKKFIELVSKSNGFSQATIEGCLQAVTDELQHWLKQGWIEKTFRRRALPCRTDSASIRPHGSIRPNPPWPVLRNL